MNFASKLFVISFVVAVGCSKNGGSNVSLQVKSDPISSTSVKIEGVHSSGQKIEINSFPVCKKTQNAQVLNVDFTEGGFYGPSLETDVTINKESNQIAVQSLSFTATNGIEMSGSAFDLKDCVSNVGQVKHGHRIEIKCKDFVDENGQEFSSLNVVADCYDNTVKAQ